MIELFVDAGFQVESITSRIIGDPNDVPFLSIIREIAQFAGIDADATVTDSIPFQYVFRVKPR